MIQLVRPAFIPAGLVIFAAGRPLKVVRVLGTDPAAPVIVEELVPVGAALAGQYSLWSVAGVHDAMTTIRRP